MDHFPAPPTSIPDDTNVPSQEASIQVDYLSHKWREEDVWRSWSNIKSQKNVSDISNMLRLENASWRTWWKQRNNLKTVSPQTLNWLKDSDVTWLYGPLFGSASPVPPPKVATTADKLNIIPHLPKGKKPILKRRTLAEVLVRGLSKAGAPYTPPDEPREIDLIQPVLPDDASPERLQLLRTTSDTNLLQPAIAITPSNPPTKSALKQALTADVPSRPTSRPPLSSSTSRFDNRSGSSRSTRERHISFNTFVTQCIAIQPGEAPGVFEEEEEEGPADWEEALETRSTTSTDSHPSSRRPGLSRSNSHSSDLSERLTIAPIPPTMLKVKDPLDDEEEDDLLMAGRKGEKPHGGRGREGPVLVYAPPTGSDSVYAARDLNHAGVVVSGSAVAFPAAGSTSEDGPGVFDYFNGAEGDEADLGNGDEYDLTSSRPRHTDLPDGPIVVGGRKRKISGSAGRYYASMRGNDRSNNRVIYSTKEAPRGQRHRTVEDSGDPVLDDESAWEAGRYGGDSTFSSHPNDDSGGGSSVLTNNGSSTPVATTPPIPIPNRSPRSTSNLLLPEDQKRGRTLVRNSSSSSLSDRAKSGSNSTIFRSGSGGVDASPIGSTSPESSRASSSRGSSATGRKVTRLDTSSESITTSATPGTTITLEGSIDVTVRGRSRPTNGKSVAVDGVQAVASPGVVIAPTETSPGIVDKAVGTARGIIGTLLGHPSAPPTVTTPPSPRRKSGAF